MEEKKQLGVETVTQVIRGSHLVQLKSKALLQMSSCAACISQIRLADTGGTGQTRQAQKAKFLRRQKVKGTQFQENLPIFIGLPGLSDIFPPPGDS